MCVCRVLLAGHGYQLLVKLLHFFPSIFQAQPRGVLNNKGASRLPSVRLGGTNMTHESNNIDLDVSRYSCAYVSHTQIDILIALLPILMKPL